jgi:hypothetical protein
LGGFLPASSDSIAKYLASYAGTLASSTLTQRLAALAQWHIEQGFPDPTKAPLVRKVLRGIRAEHPAQEKQARPLQIEQLAQVDRWLTDAITTAAKLASAASTYGTRAIAHWCYWASGVDSVAMSSPACRPSTCSLPPAKA